MLSGNAFSLELLSADLTDNILVSYSFHWNSNRILIHGNCLNWALQINCRQIEKVLESVSNSVLGSKINKEHIPDKITGKLCPKKGWVTLKGHLVHLPFHYQCIMALFEM